MRKFLGTILGSVVLGSIILGIIALIKSKPKNGMAIAGLILSIIAIVEWLCADMGRYMLGLGIFIYILYRIFKSEFGE